MTNQSCKEMEPLWDRYLRGTCTPEEERQAEEHLEQCPACQERLEQAMTDQPPVIPPAPPEPPPPGGATQQRWMRRAKWRSRLWTAFNLFCAFILVSILSGIATGLLYGLGGSSSTMQRLPQVLGTAVGMTSPNVNVDSGGVSSGFYFGLSMDYTMTKRVGHRSQILGNLQAEMRFHLLNVSREWAGGGYESRLYFEYPGSRDELNDEERGYVQETDSQVWHALEMLPEGTVSELAVSLDSLYTLEEIYAMFGGYDLDIVWYAFDTGFEQTIADQGSYLHGGSGWLWGMSDRVMLRHADRNGLEVWGDATAKERAFLKALGELQRDERWVRKVLPVDPRLQERIDYVSEQGLRSYGLVVTGPTKELLKLREHEHITRPALGETDWWNWYMPEFSSVQY